MNLEQSVFLVHNVSRFPIVTVRNEAIVPQYATAWVDEMNRLVAHDRPFVVVYVHAPPDESQEDLKLRGLWLKQHKLDLVRLCRLMVSVEEDETRRELARERGRGATKAFGVAHRAVSSLDEAIAIGRDRLSGAD